TTNVMTPKETLETAEAQLRLLVRDGASDAAINEAHVAVEDARDAIAKAEQRAVQRDRIRGELKREETAAARAERERLMNEAEAIVLERAPVITLEYDNVRVKIALTGGRDHYARQVAIAALDQAVRLLTAAHIEHIGRARAEAVGAPAPSREFHS